ncbi:MAG: response regulator [Hyphomicrobium sp.]
MKLLIVEPQPLVANQCRDLKRKDASIEIAEARTAADGLETYRAFSPAVCIVDVDFPGRTGFALIRRIRAIHSEARILACARRNAAHSGTQAIEAGAIGMIAVTGDPADLREAIVQVAAGRFALDGQAAQNIAMSRLGLTAKGPPGLTVRQIEILRLIAQDHSLNEIATRLGVSYKTVISDRARMRALLGARTQGDLIRIAIELNLI